MHSLAHHIGTLRRDLESTQLKHSKRGRELCYVSSKIVSTSLVFHFYSHHNKLHLKTPYKFIIS